MVMLKIVLAYEGTHYLGWQSQAGGKTVQDVFQAAFERIVGVRPKLVASGRTDTGVHAKGQTISLRYEGRLAPPELMKGLNALLPEDVVIRSVEIVHDTFHAQHDVTRKCYSYTLCTSPLRPLFERRFCWHAPGTLNLEALSWGLKQLEGTHDFSGFAAKGDVKDTVRTLERATLVRPGGESEPFWRFEFCSTGFLYRQVRIMVGTLVWLARCKIDQETFLQCLNQPNPTLQGDAVPPQGLCLEWVEYPAYADKAVNAIK